MEYVQFSPPIIFQNVNEKTPIDMNITFGGDGKFSMVTKDGTVKGTYTKSSDGKVIFLQVKYIFLTRELYMCL